MKEDKKWIYLNNEIMMQKNGEYQLEKDKEAVYSYFVDYVNKNTVFFHNLEEKMKYLIKNSYYIDFYEMYSHDEIKEIFKLVYDKKFRFASFMSASKFYQSYALMDDSGEKFLERYEDRISITALYLAQGNVDKAREYATMMINQEYQPATPTFLNSGKKRSGELVSCFLDEMGDSLSDIGYIFDSSMKLSSMGGGVSINLSKIRARGESIKGVENCASGVLPIMKILEDIFSYANQLNQRPGSGAVYLNVFHSDIMEFLDSKKINVDEKIRIKSLSIGVIVPDKFMQLAMDDEACYIFYPHTVYQAYGQYLDEMDMDEMYERLVDNPKVKKKKINARELLVKISQTQKESGYPYLFFKNNVNKEHPLKEIGNVKFSNLCVAPYTQILTKEYGYTPIGEHENEELHVWNGEEWSKTTIRKTGENQKLLRITTNNFQTIDVTPYHKFYIKNNYFGKEVEKRAFELLVGDKLIKFDLPEPEDNAEKKKLKNAYANGFYSGDGCEYKVKNRKNLINKIIYLYNEKKELLNKFDDLKCNKNIGKNRITLTFCKGLENKFFVPIGYDKKSIVEWLSGLADADGTISKNQENYSLQISSVELEFLLEIKLMLQELGIHSKINKSKEEGYKELPLNDGSGDYGKFYCKEIYRLLITHQNLRKLSEMGFEPQRLKLNLKEHIPNRDARSFEKILKIEELEEICDTYCFTENKRHKGMFNGILTGNCTEIMQISEVSEIRAYYEEDIIRRGISCNLGSLNIATVMENKRIREATRTAIDTLTTVSDLTNIDMVPTIKKANEELHSVGLGAMNLHGYLAKNYIMYESKEALDFCNVFFMMVNFYSLERSMEIAVEKGETFKDFDKSEYANGNYFEKYITKEYLPQTEKVKELFEGIHVPNIEDWKRLKEQVMKNGIYNAYRMAIAPNQSTSYIMNSTASVMPVVDTIEVREYGDSTTYYPMPYLTNDNWFFYKSAYDMDQKNIIKLISVIQRHVDQGISTILYNSSSDTTRDLAKLYIYAHRMGLKSLYYTRTRKATIEECLSCSV